MNPNGHAGMIYCSNLCTEIAQNMQAIEEVSKEVQTTDGDTVVVTVTRPGEFVVCNLASLSSVIFRLRIPLIWKRLFLPLSAHWTM